MKNLENIQNTNKHQSLGVINNPLNTICKLPANKVGYARVKAINSRKQKTHRFNDAPFSILKECVSAYYISIKLLWQTRKSDLSEFALLGEVKDYIIYSPFLSLIYNNIITKIIVKYCYQQLCICNNDTKLANITSEAFFKELDLILINSKKQMKDEKSKNKSSSISLFEAFS